MIEQNISSDFEPVSYCVQGKTIHGLALGKESSPVVLCLHGWLDNAASFLPMLDAIKKNDPDCLGKRFIALDWPGHGLSDHRSQDAHYHFFDYVYDLLQVIEHNGWQSVDIIGHSMGAMIANAFSAAFPEKINSLILIDALGFITAKEEDTSQQLRAGLLSRIKANQSRAKQNLARTFSKETAIKARMQVSDLAYHNAQLIVERSLKQASEQSVNHFSWRSDARVRTLSPYRMTLSQAKHLVADVVCPVLLLHGNKGMDSVNSALQAFSSLIKHFTEVELPGGHHVHMEQASGVVAELIDFWQLKDSNKI